MLQRAASNAYSWWWASHIRTKQSKWMEQNLQDMEEKVQNAIKLIEEDGDSFAKRAEMYYKKRPELINFVEETYKAYRALAERYDHISTELQNANNTIASVFPDQVPFMDDDDDDGSPRTPRKMAEGFKTNIPKPPLRDLKSVVTTSTNVTAATKKFNTKKTTMAINTSKVPKSGLSRKEALEEVDKLQKEILSLQTVKEFVKSSYDNAIAKYWETEEKIKELQERVSVLQDELGEGIVIEDDGARRLMAETALKSCQETLDQLQVKQEKSVDETKVESIRIRDIKDKLGSLMNEFQYDQNISKGSRVKGDAKIVAETKVLEIDAGRLTQQRQDLQLLQEPVKEHFEASSNSSQAATEMAEKIDELVNKVISMETAVSSQMALVNRLRTETDELQGHIRTLEADKENLIKDKIKLNDQLKEMEQKMLAVQDLNQTVEDQNSNLQTHFTEARCNINRLSVEIQSVQQSEEVKAADLSKIQKSSLDQNKSKYEPEGKVPLNQEQNVLPDDGKKSEKKYTAVIEGAVNSDAELKISNHVKDEATSDKEFKVTGSKQNVVPTENNIKVPIPSTLQMEGATEAENKPVKELKEQKNTLNPGNNDGKDTAAIMSILNPGNSDGKDTISMSTIATTENHSSEGFAKNQEKDAKQCLSMTENTREVDHIGQVTTPDDNKGSYMTENTREGDNKGQATTPDDEPDWQKMFLNGMQDREKVLLTEYTNTLRNYKDVKKRLAEIENKNQDKNLDTSLQLQLNELKTSNSLKDQEIRLLHHKLSLLQITLEGNENLVDSTSVQPQDDINKLIKIDQPASTSAIEEKFRSNMDEILEENLMFWLKFSTTCAEIQRFETTIKDLQTEVSKLEQKRKSSEGSGSIKHCLKSDARPIYIHLTEIQTEITVWFEKSALLKEELQCRFSSLCVIQEEITNALKASAEDDDFRFTSYQAAKFQGEILNMKQENNKVADELQAGLYIVTSLQLEVEKTLVKLNEQFELSTSKREGSGQLRQSETRARVPLRSFIFGVKPKKQSIFSCIAPGMHRS